MRIAIIISSNAFRSHLSYYKDFLEKQQIEFDIISWNRKLIYEPGILSYNIKQSEQKGYLDRFYSYWGYRNFVLDCLRNKKYDKIIISTIAISILLYPILIKNYRKKYLFDIRDFSMIVNFTRKIFTKVILNSAATVVSSRGFKKWLPTNAAYFESHNFPFELTNGEVKLLPIETNLSSNIDNIEITYIGSLRDFEANKLLMLSFKNELKYSLIFIGSGPDYNLLQSFALSEKISNVKFYGHYYKSEEIVLLNTSTLINNFTNDDLNSSTLTTNRFYLSVVLGIPMIVRCGTFQADLCKKYNLGCIINPANSIKEQLLEYIAYFDLEIYNTGRRDFLRLVEKDKEILDNVLNEFIGICPHE